MKIRTNTELLTFISSKGIVGTNLLIRIFVIWVLEKTGAKSETQMAYMISLSVFLFTFMNTGILVLLSNANLQS